MRADKERKRRSMSEAKMGANVLYCGHDGYFIADIHRIGNVNVVKANGEVTPGNIIRDERWGPATHPLVDFPVAGYWNPKLGIFVVPEKQVKPVGTKRHGIPC
jgi:hypothetical protein